MNRLKTDSTETARTAARAAGFETLFMEHWEAVVRVLRRLVGDPAEAEDLALEVFLRLYHHNQKQSPPENAGGWLYQVATRLGLNAIRAGQRRQQYELTAGRDALEEAEAPSPAEVLAQAEERQQVRRALAGMNERQCQLLTLRYSGFSYKEIARALNLAHASIGPLLVRAEREFEKQYRTLVEKDS